MSALRLLLIPLMLAPGAAGCGLILDFDPPDLRPMNAPDASLDAAIPADAGRHDAWPDAGDAGPAERDADGPSLDATVDAGSDSGPDDGGTPDAEPEDAGPAERDAGPPEGCADDTVEQIYPDTRDMVGCNGTRTQCAAHELCALSWHLCTFAEYQMSGGVTERAGIPRWLAACVRTGCGSPTEPISGTCATCDVNLGTVASVRFTCDAAMTPDELVACDIGVVADGVMGVRHVGATTTACSMATVAGAYVEYGATCCR